MRKLSIFVLVLGYLTILSCPVTAEAGGRYSAKFCIRDRRSFRFFDVKQIGPDAMKFGFSEWARSDGHNATIYGTAHRVGRDSWRYLEVGAPDPADHCELDFRLSPARRTVETWGDPAIPCANDVGAGMPIDHLRFPVWSYKGRVTNQLATEERFFNTGGRC